MAELQIGREMSVAVAKALGWHIEHYEADGKFVYEDFDNWVSADGVGQYSVNEWHPWTSDTDALIALDAVLAKRPEIAFILDIMAAPPLGDRLLVWYVALWGIDPRLRIFADASTRAEAICKAILDLAERESREVSK